MEFREQQAAYPLGYTESEAERLVRQAALLDPITKRFFRAAGIATGQRVLGIGSGAGDVSMLVAQLVGASGEVIAVERDPQSIARASARIASAGLQNVRFIEADIRELNSDQQFDAMVGRFVLMFLSDPTTTLRSLAKLVRRNGIVVFHEVSWMAFLKMTEHLPLWSALTSIVYKTLRCSGANPDMGLELHQRFIGAGLPAPTMRMEMVLGTDADLIHWPYDLFQTLRPKLAEYNIAIDSLGDLETLFERLQNEVLTSKAVICTGGQIGAWTQTSL